MEVGEEVEVATTNSDTITKNSKEMQQVLQERVYINHVENVSYLFIFKQFTHLFIHLAAPVLVVACSVFYDALTLTSWGRERWTFPGLAKSTHNNLSKSVSFICKLKSKAHTPNYCSLSTSQGAPSPKSPQVPDTR